jgi:hypothetical protein
MTVKFFWNSMDFHGSVLDRACSVRWGKKITQNLCPSNAGDGGDGLGEGRPPCMP